MWKAMIASAGTKNIRFVVEKRDDEYEIAANEIKLTDECVSFAVDGSTNIVWIPLGRVIRAIVMGDD